jgi:hypothetical protein
METTWRVLLGLLACSLVCEAAVGKGPSAAAGEMSPQKNSVAALRARGQAGLDEALRSYDKLRAQYAELQRKESELNNSLFSEKAGPSGGDEQTLQGLRDHTVEVERRMQRMAAAIDQVGGQRSCTVSRLYWYTDMDQAKAAATRMGRPILSLRMLGKLTDEYSCANSRFFRTALYSNKQISGYLRDHYILHWHSVRPVPRVTIDFGDGRKLNRTLTGNSAHYVLTGTGQPLDVLPGLFGARQFLAWLERVQNLYTAYVGADESQRTQKLVEFHRQRGTALYRQWVSDIERLGGPQAELVASRIDGAIELASVAGTNTPLAVAASQMAETKTATETPLLRFANFSGPWIEHGMDDELWQAVANLHRKDVKLDEASIALMRREFPPAADAGRVSFSKMQQEDPVLRMVRMFENSMSVDTVRNEYLLHRRIHEQFAKGASIISDFDALNEWVYADLFLTPSSDPWLGLAPRDVYTALENDGRSEPAAAVASRSGG